MGTRSMQSRFDNFRNKSRKIKLITILVLFGLLAIFAIISGIALVNGEFDRDLCLGYGWTDLVLGIVGGFVGLLFLFELYRNRGDCDTIENTRRAANKETIRENEDSRQALIAAKKAKKAKTETDTKTE